MPRTELTPELLGQIESAIRSVRYGTVQVTLHAGKVVQIEKIEKVRLGLHATPSGEQDTTRTPADRTSGGLRHHEGP